MKLKICAVLLLALCRVQLTVGRAESATDSATPLLAKPALVPFIENKGDILVHVSEDLLRQCRANRDATVVSIELREERGLLYARTEWDIASSNVHIDRLGRQWRPVTTELAALPLGASRVTVRACGEEVVTKVVKATWKERVTFTVDNMREQLIGADGISFIFFGSYTYGVTTDVQKSVPEDDVQFGMNWVGPYLSESKGHSNATWNSILSFLDRCLQIGVYVHYDLHALAMLPESTSKWTLLNTEVQTVMNHPAVAAYYFADEPGGQGIEPSIMEKAYDFVKGIDPNRPITEVFCCVDPAKYITSFDIGMADSYPIPSGSPYVIALKTAQLAKTGKPYFIVGQAFGGGEIWEREPTPAEERTMTYLAMLTGSMGIQYFVRSPGQFPYAGTAWSECRRLSLEFRELSSAILSGSKISVTAQPSNRILATGWPERLEGKWVVAAVNYQNSPTNMTLTTSLNYTGPATVVFQDRMVNVKQGIINDIITGYGTAVYRFPPVESNASSANLISNPSFEQVTSPSSPDGAYLNVPDDAASSYLTDTRFSVDGLHSLQLTTPTSSHGYTVLPYPTHLTAGSSYEMSFYAMSTIPNLNLEFIFSDVTPTSAIYKTETKWTKYTATLKAASTSQRVNPIRYQLVSNGTVWIDLLQLIPLK